MTLFANAALAVGRKLLDRLGDQSIESKSRVSAIDLPALHHHKTSQQPIGRGKSATPFSEFHRHCHLQTYDRHCRMLPPPTEACLGPPIGKPRR